MNDPFETLPIKQEDSDAERFHSEVRAELATRMGAICFSRDWSTPLLWSHYADGGKGLCIGFEISEKFTHNVRYVPQRINQEPDVDDQEYAKTGHFIRLMTTKSDHWRYENEVRMLVHLEATTKESGIHFVNFNEAITPVKVLIGPLCGVDFEELQSAIGDDAANIEVSSALLSKTQYTYVRSPNDL